MRGHVLLGNPSERWVAVSHPQTEDGVEETGGKGCTPFSSFGASENRYWAELAEGLQYAVGAWGQILE